MTAETIPTDFSPGVTFRLPLWPKWDQEALKKEFRKGKWSFNRGFRQQAPAEEDRLIGELLPMMRYSVGVHDLVGPEAPRYGGFDPAGEKRPGNALVTVALAESGCRVIAGVELWAGSYTTTVSRLVEAYTVHKYETLVVENVALQWMLAEWVHQQCPALPLADYKTGGPAGDVLRALQAFQIEVSNGSWALCMDDEYGTGAPLSRHEVGCECPYHVLLDDLRGYPAEKRHYDPLMALVFCRAGIRGTTGPAIVRDTVAPGVDGEIPADEIAGTFL